MLRMLKGSFIEETISDRFFCKKIAEDAMMLIP